MIATGLDRLLEESAQLAGRRFGLLAHGASVSGRLVPAHLALAAAGAAPARLFGPEHGYYGVEQDMVASAPEVDPWTGVEIVSLYGDDEASLCPRPEAFAGLDLLLVDLQDIGARYYTYAATAVWAAAAALEAGVEVWILDRPNPLGGQAVEGNLRRDGFESFVGAFRVPVRHGLTIGELFRLEAARRGLPKSWRIVELVGWRRDMLWPETG
ncbi:MAG: exo-beta-N-acetylmuramidase NamZ domain-containing protein, partial [Myxococcota bacterium]